MAGSVPAGFLTACPFVFRPLLLLTSGLRSLLAQQSTMREEWCPNTDSFGHTCSLSDEATTIDDENQTNLSDTSSAASCSEERANELLDAELRCPLDRDAALELVTQALLKVAFGKMLLAEPTLQTRRVLELSCGNGFWCEALAREYLDQGLCIEVTGTDFKKPHVAKTVPEECRYVLADIEVDAMGSAESLDIIVSVANNGRVQDWRRLCKEAFRCLRPNGCIEFQGFDFSFRHKSKPSFSDQVLKNHFELLNRVAFHVAGTDLCPMSKLREILRPAGFEVDEHIKRRVYLTPQSRDQKEVDLARILRHCLSSSLRPLAYGLLTKKLGWTESQVEDHLQEVRQAIWAPDLTVYVKLEGIVAHRGLTPSLVTDEDTDTRSDLPLCE